jgi:hypothetical protein
VLFLVILGSSIACSLLIPKKIRRKTSFKIIAFIGIIFHELSHLLMCIITGIKPSKIELHYKKQYGLVAPDETKQISFLQGFLMAIAPLIFSSYLAYGMYVLMFEIYVPFIYRILAAIAFISLIFGASPSGQDMIFVKHWFSIDLLYSLYQIFLVILSAGMIYILVWQFDLHLPFYLTFLYFIFIGFFYFILKYIFLGLRKFVLWLHMRIQSNESLLHLSAPSSRNTYRRRIVPQKSIEERIERRQW